jgi:hypothetical protein
MKEGGKRECSGCGNPLDAHNEGIELWGSWFCSACFIGHSAKLHKELTADDIALLKTIGRELSGFLPPDVLEMVLVGFYKRATGNPAPPPAAELARCVGEIQRLAAFSTFRKVLNLLKTWHGTFTEFVEQQEAEIRESVKRLTELE